MYRGVVAVVVEVSHGHQFLCHLEELHFGCVVVVGMLERVVVVVVVSVVAEVVGHLIVIDPLKHRVSLVLVWVLPVWS